MSLLLQLTISLVAAIAVTALILVLNLAEQPALLAALVLAGCCASPLLGVLHRGDRPTADSPVAGHGREQGEIKWFNASKGFGFIRRENGEEIFVHFRSIRGPHRGRKNLRDGQRVSFTVADSDKGPQAEEVETLP